LHWAAHWNDLNAMKLLLGAGANAKAANRYGSTPLSEAVVQGSGPMIEALLKAGADSNTTSSADGQTVLMTAARAGNLDAVTTLLQHGANVNAKESYKGQTALMWAAAERHSNVVAALLDHGADWKVVSQERDNKIPKLSAASSVTPMARGGLTALMFCGREGDIGTAKLMLDHGADVNEPGGDGVTALVVGLMNKHYAFAKFLLDRGADPNLADGRGLAALYAAVDSRNEDYSAMPSRVGDEPPAASLEAINALLDHGANLNAKLTKNLPGRSGMDAGDLTLDEGATPLMRAARAGDTAVMTILLAKGADPKLTTKEGSTAFMFAAGVGYRDKNTRGTEPAALEAVKLAFTTTNPDINQANSKGETALHGAALRGADTIVQYLIEHGAKINAKMKQGFTPLDVAMGKSVFGQLPVPHESTVAVIKKLGGLESKDVKDPTLSAEAHQ
jgi:ankyrin repeat protein